MNRLRLLAFLALAATAVAFPTWIGVPPPLQRHDGKNPGTFTVCLNEDYRGLRANVGIQVNDGPWREFPMTADGSVAGHSKWTHTPKEPFPPGATVKYFFHGWDDWGGNIWDTNNGRNYIFLVPHPVSTTP